MVALAAVSILDVLGGKGSGGFLLWLLLAAAREVNHFADF